jgi:hypothetical protein
MTGSPLKRQRKLGVRAEDGSVIAFPRVTYPRAGLSHAEWRGLGPAEKIERLFGMSLDDLYEIMSWEPITELDPVPPFGAHAGDARRLPGRRQGHARRNARPASCPATRTASSASL